MSNFQSNYNKNNNRSKFYRNTNEYYENNSWNEYNYNYEIRPNRSQQWFQQNWQHVNQNYRNQNAYTNDNWNNNWQYNTYRERNNCNNKPIRNPEKYLNEISPEIKVKHINKLKDYLLNDKQLDLEFVGLSLKEGKYVCNLNNINSEQMENYSCQVKEAYSSLCDIMKNVKNKVKLDYVCEENINPNLRNITYMKIFDETESKKKTEDNSENVNSDDEHRCNSKSTKSSNNVPVIKKEDLYRQPEILEYEETEDKIENDWTVGIWRKSDGLTENNNQQGSYHNVQRNRRMTKILKTYSTPVESSKAQRMMQLMGWQGGALGAKGDGITDPIIPSVTFKQGVGLGHSDEPKKKRIRRNKPISADLKPTFITNVLSNILDFIKNDLLTEISFDSVLSRNERKLIHDVVTNIRMCTYVNYDSVHQMTLVSEIYDNLKYVLETESQGVFPERKLHLYKAAPENVYLITPNDLNEEEVVEEKPIDITEDDCETIDKSENKELLENDNIDNTVVKTNDNCEEKNTNNSVSRQNFVRNMLVTYVKEFCEDDNVTEFKFLGDFDRNDTVVINCFMTDMSYRIRNCLNENNGSVLEDLGNVFRNDGFKYEIHMKDREGSILYVLHKIKDTTTDDVETRKLQEEIS